MLKPLELRVLTKIAGIRTAGIPKTAGIGAAVIRTAGTTGTMKTAGIGTAGTAIKKLESPMLTQ